MINVSNSTSKNNPSWLAEAPARPDQPTRPAGSAGHRGGRVRADRPRMPPEATPSAR